VPGFEKPTVDQDGLVKILLFGQSYHIRTDNPELVFRLAYRVQSFLKDVLAQDPSGALGHGTEALVQAAFRLALKLDSAERETATLKAHVEQLEKRIRRVISLVDVDF
jgi:hypothetical protein